MHRAYLHLGPYVGVLGRGEPTKILRLLTNAMVGGALPFLLLGLGHSPEGFCTIRAKLPQVIIFVKRVIVAYHIPVRIHVDKIKAARKLNAAKKERGGLLMRVTPNHCKTRTQT